MATDPLDPRKVVILRDSDYTSWMDYDDISDEYPRDMRVDLAEKAVHVKGYRRADGTYVSGYNRMMDLKPFDPAYWGVAHEDAVDAPVELLPPPEITSPPDPPEKRLRHQYQFWKNWYKDQLTAGKYAKDVNWGDAGYPGEYDDLVGMIEERLDFIKTLPVNIRVPRSVLSGILDTGRVRSQFETHTSSAYYNPTTRGVVESKIFGGPEQIPPYDRPIYGYIAQIGSDHSVEYYGNVSLKLRPDVVDRTTWVGGDALNVWGYGVSHVEWLYPSKMSDPKFSSIDDKEHILRTWLQTGSIDEVIDEITTNVASAPYWEAHIWGRVTLDDVESIHLHDPERSDMDAIRELRQMGITVTYDPEEMM